MAYEKQNNPLVEREAQQLKSSRIMHGSHANLQALIPKASVNDWDKPDSQVFDDGRRLTGLIPQPKYQLSNTLAGRTLWITYPIEKNDQQLRPKWVIQLNLTRPTFARLQFDNVVPIIRVSAHQRTPKTALTTMPFRADVLNLPFARPSTPYPAPLILCYAQRHMIAKSSTSCSNVCHPARPMTTQGVAWRPIMEIRSSRSLGNSNQKEFSCTLSSLKMR